MKQLTLIRHAKSDWDTGLPDFERPLNERGERSAPHIASRMAQYHVRPDLLITSPAVRALRTANLIARGLGIPETEIVAQEALYDASSHRLVDVIRGTADDIGHLMLVAHNPGITELANLLTDSHIDNLVTCAALGAELEIGHWRELQPGCGRVIYYDFPKNPSQPVRR